MTPFLKQIAEAYVTDCSNELIDYCFVFPNKRCATFFSNYISQISHEIAFQPAMISIETLVNDITKSIAMSRIEQLFVLFDCYRTIVRKNMGQEPSLFFDSFLSWGETILNDFNDVDRYLADTSQLFKNIKFFKEIASNFLTDEQIEVINRYWRDPIVYNADARMWKHLDSDSNDEDVIKKFFSLWLILHELYEMFRQELKKRNLSYSGMIYRDAVEHLKNTPFSKDELPYKKYIFVGFNALSASEEKIFAYFRDNGIGYFYWDYDSPAFNLKYNPATTFVGRYVTQFPPDPAIGYNFSQHKPESFPEINIIGIPSTFGQTKKTAEILERMIRESPDEFTPDKAKKTAVVLPDETLCIPLVNSLPPIVRPINITMGYPIKNTPVAFLIKNIIKLQDRIRYINGSFSFYFEDIKTLLAHPLLRSAYPTQCENIIRRINDKHIFNYPQPELISDYPELADFFMVFDNNASAESLKLIGKLLQHLKLLTENNGLEHAFILNYIKSLEKVESMCRKYHVELSHSTIFHLLQRLAGGESVHFAGEPLEGIQIMGMLETRALDFDNLIVLSMNERIFPRKIQTKSFIPMELRSAYNLSTIDHQESIFAYYFYRLITRAKKVYLLYDARTGTNSGEMSRYLYQLKYIYSDARINHIMTRYSVSTPKQRIISVSKTKSTEIMNRINRFREPDSGVYLSASSINRFIECPLAFYLENIAGYKSDDEMKDYIDDGLYGTIMHSVAENIYKDAIKEFGSDIFNPETLNKLIATRRNIIEHEVTAAIKEFYYKTDRKLLPESGLRISDLPGDTEIIAEIICDKTIKMLQRESENPEFCNFRFIEGEKRFEGYVQFTKKLAFNIKGFIDRVDKSISSVTGHETLRFIDYKTGFDKLEVKDIGQMFDVEAIERPKAVLQLMLYCNAYSKLYNYNSAIIPVIYKLKTLSIEPLNPITVEKNPLTDYRTVNDEFLQGLEDALMPLFDPEIPFTQTKNPDKACKFCKFIEICDKQQKKI